MNRKSSSEIVDCPYCGAREYAPWAEELGFMAVRCSNCAIIYVNPRPTVETIDSSVRTGLHGEEAHGLVVVERRINAKVSRYERLFNRMFADVWKAGNPISWLDVGAGYGEVMEAVVKLAPPGSRVEGIEPMQPKAAEAKVRGLAVTEGYLEPTYPNVNFISVVNVFSHLPHFGRFLATVKGALSPNGEVFIETGNLADLIQRNEFPGELGLPDHLVFAGEKHLRGFLNHAGFEVLRIEKERIDGFVNLAKNLVKKAIGRPACVGVPYMSNYRQLLVRAKLR